MKNVDHSYEQALIMHDNLHIHVIMNIIVTPISGSILDPWNVSIRGHDNFHDDMNMYVIMHDQCLFIAMVNSFHT